MKISWLPRESGHWKLVVEPLTVLLTLKRVGDQKFKADCLAREKIIQTPLLEVAKLDALHWFRGILDELEKELGQLRSEGAVDPPDVLV